MALVKLVPGSEFVTNNRTVAATKLQEDDGLINVIPVEDEAEAVLQTKNGFFLRFALEEISEMKKNSRGVRGIKLEKDDELEAVYLIGHEPVIQYKKKEVHLNRLKIGKRDTKGNKVRL
jgi:DNA gyrase subunit A